MQHKSWAWPLLGWAIWCVPTFQIPVLLWMSSWLQSSVESPCNPALWAHTSWLYFYIHLSPVHKRHRQGVGECTAGKIQCCGGRYRNFHLLLSAFVVLLCRSQTGRWFLQKNFHFALMVALWKLQGYPNSAFHQTHLLLAVRNIWLFLLACGVYHWVIHLVLGKKVFCLPFSYK